MASQIQSSPLVDSIEVDWPSSKSRAAQELCAAFLHAPISKRFVFGLNVYTKAVVSILSVAGIVDDYTSDSSFNDTPIIRSVDLPRDAFVLTAAGGRPLTVRRMLRDRNIRQIDYFRFLRWSGLPLPEAVFNEGFKGALEKSRAELDWLFGILEDAESREVLLKLMQFRASYDLDYLEGFAEKQSSQYFEDFLELRGDSQVFVDVGGFDGATTEEFIRLCPAYKSIFVLEPEPSNYRRCVERLDGRRNLSILPIGAGDDDITLRFSSGGSASRLDESGEISVKVQRLDELVHEPPTFIKMDIEGAEASAIRGASRLIEEHQPTLAICVYHRPSDFWEIPRTILKINSNYSIFIRHYTESIYETVMYFVPKGTRQED